MYMRKNFLIAVTLFLVVSALLGNYCFASAVEPSRKVTITPQNVSLNEIISQIEEQTGFLFITKEDVDLSARVTVSGSEMYVREIMEQVANETPVNYHIQSHYIVLSKKQTIPKSSTQEESVLKGKVTDESGEPLVGAYVAVKGTTLGTVTDADGNFSISGDFGPDTILAFEFMGMKPYETVIGMRSVINVTLAANRNILDEVIVVGYGTETKVNLTGSVASVKASTVQNRSVSSVSAALQGLVPGMTITQAGGQPGMDNGSIRIRGVGSFNTSSPMILIDGVEGDMNVVDANDIETISVLKDASSAAIYGSKAANGVILITTKRGKSGVPKLTYNGMAAWSAPADLMKKTSSAQYAQLINEAEYWEVLSNGGTEEQARAAMPYSDNDIALFRDGSDPYGHANTDWYDLFFCGSGFSHKHNLSIAGGNEFARYNASLGYNKRDGIIKNASNEQFNGRVNLDVDLTKKLSVKMNLSYTSTMMKEPTNPISWNNGNSTTTYRQVYRISPMVVYKYQNGDYGYMADGNPIAWQDMGNTGNTGNDFVSLFSEFSYKIIDGLKISANMSYNYGNKEYTLYRGDIWYDDVKYDGPIRLTRRFTKDIRKQSEILLTYDKTFGNHTINFLAGFHGEEYKWRMVEAYRQGFPSTEVTDLNGGSVSGQKTAGYSRELSMNSVFGRIKYNYANRYLFEANLRADGTSRFAPGHRWGYFPSVSAAWRLSNEDFMEAARSVMTDMKLRASYGILGNQDVNDYYPYINTYSTSPKYPFGDKISNGAAMTGNKIRDISWETTRTWGLALDATFFDSLSIILEYYNKRTTGILMQVNVPQTYGYAGYWDNVGKMKNQGIELTLNYKKAFGDFVLSAGGNLAWNKNEVISLGNVDSQKNAFSIVMVGKEYRAFYGYKADGLFQSKEEIANAPKYTMISNDRLLPGDIKLVDVNHDNVIDAKDKITHSSENPRVTYAINLGLKWKSLDFSAFFQGAAGVSRYFTDEMYGELNGNAGHPSSIWMNRWTPERPNNDFPRSSKFRTYNMPDTIVSDYWLVNAGYLRLKDLQVGWTIPQRFTQLVKISNARIYYDATNLLTFKSCPQGIDPEAPAGWGAYYPHVRTHSFGVTLTF